MKKTGAQLLVHALEQIGIRFTLGIPGVHTIEIYDELNKSEQITPILVTHECGASFMADGISRTSKNIGTLVIVPAAGTTHAMSGIGEAYLDGIPMLIVTGGTRRDSGRYYQLHQLDQKKLADGITKGYFLVTSHDKLIATIYEAYNLAISGEPGPVLVEIPAEIQLFQEEIDEMPAYKAVGIHTNFKDKEIKAAVDILLGASNPGLFVGWGSVKASAEIKVIAEILAAPVSTTLQGLSSFPGNHPLHTGVGFGPASVPASQNAFKNCDCLLAVGLRFAELSTGSYGAKVPENLIHVDINKDVFDKNYPAKCTLEGDSQEILKALITELRSRNINRTSEIAKKGKTIQEDKQSYFAEWTEKRKDEIVSPGFFFRSLREKTPDDIFVVADDGQHTFLTAELMPCHVSGHFISPTDFNCMGYCVPAAIGTKLANADKMVVAIAGDGAFLMTGMELLTAKANNLGLIVFVFNDGELGQISQFQKIPLNRKTCTVLPEYKIEGIAIATGSEYLFMKNDHDIESVIDKAIQIASQNKPVIVEVNIDYSKNTFLTKGVMKINLSRFSTKEKIRFLGRAVKRHIFG
ncbi:MAG: thiamine pyrophosphate-binding protein [Bacteroidetes bacterium]|nr:MAG: thiamine pyrophosphate-binding protein [Bacteroidota bacterium]